MRLGWKFILPISLGFFVLVMFANLIALATPNNVDLVANTIWFLRRIIFPYLILDLRDLEPFFS